MSGWLFHMCVSCCVICSTQIYKNVFEKTKYFFVWPVFCLACGFQKLFVSLLFFPFNANIQQKKLNPKYFCKKSQLFSLSASFLHAGRTFSLQTALKYSLNSGVNGWPRTHSTVNTALFFLLLPSTMMMLFGFRSRPH